MQSRGTGIGLWIWRTIKVSLAVAAVYYAGINAPGIVLIALPLLLFCGGCAFLLQLAHGQVKFAFHAALTCLLLLPVALTSLLGPMHALFSLVTDLFPALAAGINSHLKYLELPLPLADAAACLLAAFGTLALAVVIWREQRQMREMRRQIENLATSRVQAAALGLVELSGRYQFGAEPTQPGVTPFTWYPDYQRFPFYLRDTTGQIKVDPSQEFSLAGLVTGVFQLGLPDIALSRGSLVEGDPVFVVGTLETDTAAPSAATGVPALVVRRRSRPKQAFFEGLHDLAWKLLGGGSRNLSPQDLFFITDGDETTVQKRLRRVQYRSLVRGLALLLLCLWLFASRLDRLLPRGTILEEPAFYTENVQLHWLLAHTENSRIEYRTFARSALEDRRSEISSPVWTAFVLHQLTASFPDSREWAANRADDLLLDAGHARFTPALVAVVERGENCRYAAVRALSRIREPRHLLPGCFIAWSQAPDGQLRRAALLGMEAFGMEQREFLPALADRLGDPEAGIAAEAARILRLYGAAALPVLQAAARTGNPFAQAQAVSLVAAAETDSTRLLAFLKSALKPGSRERQLAALDVVLHHQPPKLDITPEVARLLADRDPVLRSATLRALEGLELDRLGDPDWEWIQTSLSGATRIERRTAWRLLRQSPLDQRSLGESLLHLTHSRDPEVAIDALVSLSEAAAVRDRAVSRLLECLAVDALRDTAIRQLGELGPDAAVAVPQLVSRVLAPEAPNRTLLIGALRKIGSVPGLLACLDPRNDTHRAYVYESLGELGPRAVPAVATLVNNLRTTGQIPEERAILVALANMGPAAGSALPEVEAIIDGWTHGNHAWDSAAQALMQLRRPLRPVGWTAQSVPPPRYLFRLHQTLAAADAKMELQLTGDPLEWRTGRQGLCAFLNGGSVLVGTPPAELALAQGYTLEVCTWFDLTRRAADGEYVLLDSDLCQIYTRGARELMVDIYSGTGEVFTTFRFELAQAGVWRHWSVVWDPFERKVQLYGDGKIIGSVNDWGYSLTLDPPPVKLHFRTLAQVLKSFAVGGCRPRKNGATWRKNWIGRVDGVAIYDHPRSAEQVAVDAQTNADR